MGELKYQLDMLKKPTWKFVNASDFAKENLLYIQESGRFCSGKDYYTKRSGLDSYLIKVTISGKGTLEYAHEKYDLVPNSVMFIDCKKLQKYYTDCKSGKWEMLWVHFNGKNARAYYEKYLEKTGGSPVCVLGNSDILCEITESLIDLSGNYSKSQDSEILADNLINSLLKECIVKSGGDNGSAPNYIKDIAGYLKNHYMEEIDLDFLAGEFNISKFHLQRMFKETMGISPAKYLSNVRVNKAKGLLRGTNLCVSEIAEKVGMETNYFIQFFKSLENLTPLQYRKNWGSK